MIVSHEKQFVLFAPWKTASTTAHGRLARYNQSPYSRFYHFNPTLRRVVHQHITCADFVVLPEARLDYRRGAFVRNPYDRVYSGFQQIQRDFKLQPTVKFEADWVRELVMHQLSDNFAQVANAGFDFNNWVMSLTDGQVLEIGRNSSFPLHPACYWTHLGVEQYVDFIGRTEKFEADFDWFCKDLDLDPAPPMQANRTEVDEAPGGAGPYRHAGRYTLKSLDRVTALFALDFDLLGYERLHSLPA